MNFIVFVCWAFLGLCFIVEAKSILLMGITALGWETPDWAGWVQAIGSIAAILGSFLVGAKQSKDALRAIRVADDLAVARKRAAIVGISEAASKIATDCRPIFEPNGFNCLVLHFHQLDAPLAELNKAFEAIPIHEIGTAESVTELIQIKVSMLYLERALKRAYAAINENELGWVAFDATALHMNCDSIISRTPRLILSLHSA